MPETSFIPFFLINYVDYNTIPADRLLIENHTEKRTSAHIVFLDLDKAFHRVSHDLIWYSKQDLSIPKTYFQWVKLLYSGATSAMKCPVGQSSTFHIRVDVHQGLAVSLLCCSYLLWRLSPRTSSKSLRDHFYADDVMLAAKTRRALQILIILGLNTDDETMYLHSL